MVQINAVIPDLWVLMRQNGEIPRPKVQFADRVGRADKGEDKGRGAKSSASFPVLCSEKTTSTEKNTDPLNGFLN
jgi:hypothetical protein